MSRLRIIFDAILSVNERDIFCMCAFLVLSLLVSAICGWKGVLFLIVMMVAREVWQYKVYHLPHYEWEDVVRYSLIILLGYLAVILSVKC